MTARCSCRKNKRPCYRSSCDCDQLCQNLEIEETDRQINEESLGESCSSALSTSAVVTVSGDVELMSEEANYDRKEHTAMWHNDNPFVLTLHNNRLKKCRGCGTRFTNPKVPDVKFVICHDEEREFWTSHGRRVSSSKAYYHCSSACISSRHPYFKPREVTASPSVARKLTKNDVQLIKDYGIDLSFVRK